MKNTKADQFDEAAPQTPSILSKAKLKLEEWTHYHLATEKIDFMSVNRLRQTISAMSDLPCKIPFALQTRTVAEKLLTYVNDETITFENMQLILNPYDRTPLTAVAIFHTDTPCRLSYTIKAQADGRDFCRKESTLTTSHFVPVFGLYPGTENTIEFSISDDADQTLSVAEKTLSTVSLSEEECAAHPTMEDGTGTIRYFLGIEADSMGLFPLSGDRYLVAEYAPIIPTYGQPHSVLLHELDLLGAVYRTYYIANGIHDAVCEKEPGGNLLVLSSSFFRHMNDTVLEINRTTGAVTKLWDFRSSFDVRLRDKSDWIHLDSISYSSEENALFVHSQEMKADYTFDYTSGKLKKKTEYNNEEPAYTLSGLKKADITLPETLNPSEIMDIEFCQVGWLSSPSLYKGASVETIDAVDVDTMFEKYELRFSISGDLFLIEIGTKAIQEILFVKSDRIYQMDATEILQTRKLALTSRYTIALPFTEMYSGTYSIVFRFADGAQEVLRDTITLSRTRAE